MNVYFNTEFMLKYICTKAKMANLQTYIEIWSVLFIRAGTYLCFNLKTFHEFFYDLTLSLAIHFNLQVNIYDTYGYSHFNSLLFLMYLHYNSTIGNLKVHIYK